MKESMKQQTAVEWLEQELKDRYPLMNSEPFFEQAKQMEKEQRKETCIASDEQDPDTGLDEFYYHEILDRLTVTGDIVERHLLDHPVTEKHIEIKTEVEAAIKHLAEAYMKMGGIVYRKGEADYE